MNAVGAIVLAAGTLAAVFPGVGVAAPPGVMPCLRVLKPMTADSAVSSANFVPVACPAGAIGKPFRYWPQERATHLIRSLEAGEIVSAFPEFGAETIEPGDVVVLASSAGKIRIERDVEALQAARPGDRLFVRARDGNVFSVGYDEVAR